MDAAEEHASLADVGLVGADRRVRGYQQHIVATGDERGSEGIVVQTAAAKHATRARSDIRDPHVRAAEGTRLANSSSGVGAAKSEVRDGKKRAKVAAVGGRLTSEPTIMSRAAIGHTTTTGMTPSWGT